jgi:hypothetical protein
VPLRKASVTNQSYLLDYRLNSRKQKGPPWCLTEAGDYALDRTCSRGELGHSTGRTHQKSVTPLQPIDAESAHREISSVDKGELRFDAFALMPVEALQGNRIWIQNLPYLRAKSQNRADCIN